MCLCKEIVPKECFLSVFWILKIAFFQYGGRFEIWLRVRIMQFPNMESKAGHGNKYAGGISLIIRSKKMLLMLLLVKIDKFSLNNDENSVI